MGLLDDLGDNAPQIWDIDADRQRLAGLALRTPGRRSTEETEEMVALQRRIEASALARFDEVATAYKSEVEALEPLDRDHREGLVDTLQVAPPEPRPEAPYLSHEAGSELLMTASRNRVTVNTIYRQAAQRAAYLEHVVAELETIWLGMGTADTEWKNRALVGPRLAWFKREHHAAKRHADYCYSAYWSLQRVCEEIVQLVKVYDRAHNLGAPTDSV